MKLIRRKPKPTPTQKGLDVARAAVRGLAAVRVARTAFKTYKFARRLPLLIAFAGVAAGAAVAVRKLRGGDGPETETWAPPTPTAAATNGGSAMTTPAPTPAPAASTPTPASPAAAAAPSPQAEEEPDHSPEPELNANPAETAATGTPPVELAEADEPPNVEPVEDLPAAGTVDAPVPDEEPAPDGKA